jgi:hypothetical protein
MKDGNNLRAAKRMISRNFDTITSMVELKVGYCPCCEKSKPVTDFRVRQSGLELIFPNLGTYCKECAKSKHREYYKEKRKEEISLSELKEILEYREDGHLYWKKHKTKEIGSQASVKSAKYLSISINGRQYYEHDLVWFYHTGSMPRKPYCVDHINEDNFDNRIENLRLVSYSINLRDTTKNRKNNKSGVRGVRKLSFIRVDGSERIRFRAYMTIEGVVYWLGDYKTKEEAVLARLKGERVACNMKKTPAMVWLIENGHDINDIDFDSIDFVMKPMALTDIEKSKGRKIPSK